MPKTRYLWAAALVALCLSLASGAAFAAAPLDSWQNLPIVPPIFPDSLAWDQSADVEVDAFNDGDTSWNSTYGLVSVEGTTPTSSALPIDRWGVALLPIAGVTVAPDGAFDFTFPIVAPPITSLKYDQPVTVTEPGTLARFACSFILAHPITPTATLIPTDIAANEIAISRFPDIQPGTLGDPFRFWVEELTGRVPFIVKGYPDGTYRSRDEVSRDQMATFVARAVAGGDSKVPEGPPTATFPDVPTNYWAFNYIEFAVDRDVVIGYPDGTYRPLVVVNRDQMAVFISRGMVGGDQFVPTGPPTATFPDVLTNHWAFKYIEFAVAQGVVIGYPDGTYRPGVAVDRGQMAVFVWRAFMMPTGTVVVLAGPAVTAVDPDTAEYVGWSSASSGPQDSPGFAYVGFDAVRLDTNLVFPHTPSGTWQIKFELMHGASPTPAASTLILLDAADIIGAVAAAMDSGDPYFFVFWQIPSGLDKTIYTLVVSVSDETGLLNEIESLPSHPTSFTIR